MKVHCYKIPISVSNLDVKKVLVYDGFAYSKNKETEAKYFIGYKTVNTLLQMSGYLNKVAKIQYMSFVTENEKLLEKYELIWNRISRTIGTILNTKYLNTKLKSYNNNINTDFQAKIYPKNA